MHAGRDHMHAFRGIVYRHNAFTCPEQVYNVVHNENLCRRMARAKVLSAISDAISSTLCSSLHPQLSHSVSPVNIGLALLKEIWWQSSSSHFCSFCEGLCCHKGAQTVQHEVHDCCNCIGDVPIL